MKINVALHFIYFMNKTVIKTVFYPNYSELYSVCIGRSFARYINPFINLVLSFDFPGAIPSKA